MAWQNDYLKHPSTAFVLVGLALGFTVIDTVLATRGARTETRRAVALGELSVGLSMMALDGFVRRNGVVFETGPTLGSWWPVIGLLAAGTYLPRWAAFVCGALFGVARTLSVELNGFKVEDLTTVQWLSLVNTGFFAALAAVTAGGLVRLLRRAESEVALARARDEVARTLHDGVLQTLALVERRSEDVSLVAIVRQQERELRELLNDRRKPDAELDLRSGLDAIIASFERHHGGTGQVIVAPDLPPLSKELTLAFLGAATEAMNNAAKHGAAKSLTIYVEPDDDDGVICSIKDDGKGFVVGEETAGFGMANSMVGRMSDVGGTVTVKSTPGTGTEVVLWAH